MKFNQLGYLIKEGFKSIFTHGFMSFASVTIIIACLVIMGSFTLLSVNIDEAIVDLEQENEVVCFVDEELSDEDSQAIQPAIESIDNIATLRYTTREEAFADFSKDFDAGLFEDVDASVLRHRYVVTLKDITMMAQTITQLKSAVVLRRKPVKPMKEPQMELKKMVPMKGAQCRLCLPMLCSTMP